ncbi:MAG TPA: HAD family hydrolase [Steroidobacteraceae bacterium]|nr:HAD family hydrolase [Steroidobacteraceae bacterium]
MSDYKELAAIDAVVMDVDGVLTDGTFEWSESGDERKRFSFEDVMGLSRARQAGLVLGLISGEDSALVDRFARKVGITHVVKGCKDKGAALRSMAEAAGVALARVAYIGDDVNDLSALAIAGWSAAPANAQPAVKAAVDCVLERRGGRGAVRQLVESILEARRHGGTG